MRPFLLSAGILLLGSFLVGCPAFSGERVRSSSSSEGTLFVGSDFLSQGVAVGDVSSQSALLWLRTNGPVSVQIEWATISRWEQASKLATVVAPVSRTVSITTTSETDYTLTIPLEGLSPATRYRYRVLVGSADQTTRQLPAGLVARGEFTTLPDEKLFLGDTIYSDDICPSPPNELGADFKATTLQTYRARHRYQRGAEALRQFLETTPVYVVWDDHEVRNNFAGPFEEQMPAGRQALREYWPIASPVDDPHRLYRRVRYGADLELFILDTRQYRSRNADPDGPAKTMLGAAQLAWLLDGLRTSTATWKVIVTSVPLSIPKGGDATVPGNDGWAGGPDGTGFERERRVIVATILSDKLKNVVFLAGDVHLAQVTAYDPDRDGVIDFHEYVTGPLSARHGKLTATDDGLHPTQLYYESGFDNFGLVRVTKDKFAVAVVDEVGNTRFSHAVPARP
ncbi:MAG: hypothetical protein E8D40_10595 [Nitrospira sp.]|nr:MAG: hypothetical protein E8D40_10595 [Nitrospira sp.]